MMRPSYPSPLAQVASPSPSQHKCLDLLIALVMAPFFLFPQTWITLLLMAAILLLWLFRWLQAGFPLQPMPLHGPLLLMVGLLLVSQGATYNLHLSFPKVSGVYYGIVLCLMLSQALRAPRAFGLAATGLLVGGAAVALVGLLGTRWTSHKLPFVRQVPMLYQQIPRLVRGLPRAPQGFNPNQVGGTLTLFLPFAVTLFIYLIKHRRAYGPWVLRMVGTSVILMLMTVTLILTQSRWSYVSAFLALLLLGLSQPGLLRWLTVIVCLVVVGVVIFLGPVTVAYGVLGDSTLESWTAQGFLPGRVEIWQRAAAVIRDHPLTGIGFDTVVPIVHARYPTYLLAPGSDFTHAHNLYLQTALDLGIPGLIGFLALLIVWVRMLWQVQQQAEHAFDRALATGLLFGVTGQLLFGLADAIALGQKPGIFFWAYLGVGAALWIQSEKRSDKPHDT